MFAPSTLLPRLLRPLVRARRSLCVLAALAAAAPLAHADTPAPDQALGIQPVQPDVPFQSVDPADVDSCVVKEFSENGWTGWIVETADGIRLRRFADTNGDEKIDQWCYYDQGVEVYRDIDSNFNGKVDQYRWLGTAGTRWGLDQDESGSVDAWKQISAEEVSAEVVAALANRDTDRFAALLATDSEIRALGLGKSATDRLLAKTKAAVASFADLADDAAAVAEDARWVQFASTAPGVVPAGTEGAQRDVKVYENAVAMFDSQGKGGQVLIGTLVQAGDNWRLIDVPHVLAEDQPLTQSVGFFFTPGGNLTAVNTARASIGAETQELVSNLERIDGQLATASSPTDLAELNRRRVDVVERLIAAASDPVERETWMRQLVDTVSMAVQTGSYPEGIQRLRRFSASIPSSAAELQAYTQFQIISADYASRQMPDADFAKVQEWYLGELNKFVQTYPDSREAGQAMLQLGLNKEFEERLPEAIEYYGKVAQAFAGTDMGEKAAGAVRRLQSAGKALPFTGRTLGGEAFNLAALRGRPVVIHYWATWCEACKQDMKLLRQLQAKYQSSRLQIVGVNVDSSREQAAAYLKENSVPWPQLFEDGGLESSGLAKQLGVQTLPMMLLIDADGNVVSHNVYAANLDAELAKIARPAAANPARPAATNATRPAAANSARPTSPGGVTPGRPATGGSPAARPAATRSR